MLNSLIVSGCIWYVCAAWIIWSGHICYHDGEQHLRRDDHHRQGIAVIEGNVRYGHQGGGQRQACQGLVSLKRIIQGKRRRRSQQPGLLTKHNTI
jgi:hypothetical protein